MLYLYILTYMTATEPRATNVTVLGGFCDLKLEEWYTRVK
jgi:hypothetical protein